jgi:hypothetical protein
MRQQAGACEASIAAVVDTPHPHARPPAKRSVLSSSGSKAAAFPTSEGWTKLTPWAVVTQITEELGGLGLDFLPPAVDVALLAQAAAGHGRSRTQVRRLHDLFVPAVTAAAPDGVAALGSSHACLNSKAAESLSCDINDIGRAPSCRGMEFGVGGSE